MSVDNMLPFFFKFKIRLSFFACYFTVYAKKKYIVLLILFVGFCHKMMIKLFQCTF